MPTKPTGPNIVYQPDAPLGPALLRALLFLEDEDGTPGMPVVIKDWGPLGHDITFDSNPAPAFSAGDYGADGATLGSGLGGTGSDAGLPTGTAELSATILINTTYTGAYVTLFSRGGFQNGDGDQQIYINGGRVVVASWGTLLQGVISVADGNPHVIQIDFKDANVSTRIDGAPDTGASGALTWDVPSSGSLGLCVGAEVAGSPVRPYPGFIDGLFLYDISRDSGQLAADLADPFRAVTEPTIPAQTISPTGIPSSAALGTPTVTVGSPPAPPSGVPFQRIDAPAGTYYLEIVRSSDGEQWNGSGWETFNVANWLTYAVPTVVVAGTTMQNLYMPDGITGAGLYRVTMRTQLGDDPDVADPTYAAGAVDWDGTKEVSASSIAIDPTTVVNALMRETDVEAGLPLLGLFRKLNAFVAGAFQKNASTLATPFRRPGGRVAYTVQQNSAGDRTSVSDAPDLMDD